jgi:hypothetical protein
MFADHWIVLSQLKLAALEFRVLGGGVEVSGTGRRDQLDNRSHGLSPLRCFPQGGFNAELLYGADTAGADAHPHEAVLDGNPDTLPLQVRLPRSTRFIVCVRYVLPVTVLLPVIGQTFAVRFLSMLR